MTDSEKLIELLQKAGKRVITAESLTAGLVADLLAQTAGASKVLWGSYVCYTVEAKSAMLGISEKLIAEYGAVSRETACAMAEGALKQSAADIALSVTGLAGPGGDGTETPVGTVWIGIALRGKEVKARRLYYKGSRNEIRTAAAVDALRELLLEVQRDTY